MGDLPVPCLPAAIFWTCGYPNQLHFFRAFKKRYGLSPREWRNQNKGRSPQ